MNYYERHLGDYARDAAHLSLAEHGAYTVLLDRYYATEKGIPADQAYRVARARTEEERASVDAVLDEFFILTNGVWIQAHAERKIAEYQEGDPDREMKRDNDKERQRRARERRRQLFGQLREFGVVPEWNASTAQLQSMLSRELARDNYGDVTPPVTEPVTPFTRDNTATHTPTTNPNSKEEGESASEESERRIEPTPAAQVCIAARKLGLVRFTSTHPDLLQALADGVTVDALGECIAEAHRRGKHDPFVYGITAARSEHAKGATKLAVVANARAGPGPTAGHGKVMGALLTLEGMKSGNQEGEEASGYIVDQGRVSDGLPDADHARLGGPARC